MRGSPDFSFVPSDAILDKELPHAVFRTFAIICMHVNRRQNGSYPSYATIAKELDVDRRNVIRYINELCERGYLVKEAQERTNGSAASNFYHLNYSLTMRVDTSKEVVVKNTTTLVVEDTPPSGTGYHPLYNNQSNTKKNITKSNTKKLTLEQWEQKQGCILCIQQMAAWGKEKGLDAGKVAKAIDHFRTHCMANGTTAANFVMAFQNWVNRGFMDMSLEKLRPDIQTKSQATFVHGSAI